MAYPEVETKNQMQAIIDDSNFWVLPPKEKVKVLAHFDDDFRQMDAKEQTKFVGMIKPGMKFSHKETKVPKIRTATRMAGGIAGGIAGAVSPVPGGTIGGTILGAGAADSAYQLVQHAVGSPHAPRTSLESAKEIGEAALIEGVGEAVGRGAGKALAPMAKKVIPEVVALSKHLESKIKPIVFTPAEMTESSALDVIQNVTESSILGGGRIKQFKMARSEAMTGIADDMVRSYGKSVGPEEAGNLFVDTINKKWDAHKSAATLMYNTASDAVPPGTMVNVGSVIEKTGKGRTLWNVAQETVNQAKVLNEMDAEKQGFNLANDVLDILKKNKSLLDPQNAMKLRTILLSKAREISLMDKNAAGVGLAKKMAGMVDEGIETALKPHTDALTKWRAANEFYSAGREKFNPTFIRRLVNMASENGQGAEFIGRNIFKPGNVRQIRAVRDALGPDSKEWRQMKSFYMSRIFRKSVQDNADNPLFEQVDGKLLYKQLFGKSDTAIGHKTIQEVFGKAHADELYKFTKALTIMQKKQGEGLGKMLIQLTQGGAIMGFATGFAPEAAGIILTPSILSRMMLKPTMVKYLTKGFQVHARQPEALGIMVRLMHGANELYKEDIDKAKGSAVRKVTQFKDFVKDRVNTGP